MPAASSSPEAVMLHPDFDIAWALASVACPRCGRVGLDQLDPLCW